MQYNKKIMDCHSRDWVNPNHLLFGFSNLNKLRKENLLCDVALHVGDEIISAHKNILAAFSPYFHVMFTGSFPESKQKDIVLKDVDVETFKIVIDYMYTGELNITSENVQWLLTTSSFLQVTWVQEKCCEFLKNELDPSNCLGIKKLADKLSCNILSDDAKTYALKHLRQLSVEEEFLLIDIEEYVLLPMVPYLVWRRVTTKVGENDKFISMQELLSYPEICYNNDDIIFSCIIMWTNFLLEERTKYLNDLLSFVHPALVSKDLVNSCESLKKNSASAAWLAQATDIRELEWSIFILDKIGKNSDLHKYGLKTDQQISLASLPYKAFALSLVGYNDLLFAQGGAIDRKSSDKCYRYHIYRDKWTEFSSLKIARSHHRSCLLQGSIYAIGGNGLEGAMCNVETVDLETGIPTILESMMYDRTSFGATVYDNSIYVMGGENEEHTLYSLERYDPRLGTWDELCSLHQVNSYCSCAVVTNYIYCSEGLGNSMERYDPRNNSWELIELNTDREFYELFSINDELFSISGTGIYKYVFNENDWKAVLTFSTTRDWDTAVPLKTVIV